MRFGWWTARRGAAVRRYHRRVVALTPAILASGWLALLLAAPVLPAPLSAILYAVASLVCHQLPERSFHIGLAQLPVCARCAGIYAGAAAGSLAALAIAFGGRRAPAAQQASGASARLWLATFAALLPTIVTVSLEWMGVWFPSNVTRALAGAPAGAVVAFVVTRALATVHYGEWAPRRPTASSPPRSSI